MTPLSLRSRCLGSLLAVACFHSSVLAHAAPPTGAPPESAPSPSPSGEPWPSSAERRDEAPQPPPSDAAPWSPPAPGTAYPPPSSPPYAYPPGPYPPEQSSYAAWPAYGLPEYPYVPSAGVPPGYHLESRARPGLVVTGLVLTVVPYTFGVMGASAVGFEGATPWLLVPFAGPWIAMGAGDYLCARRNALDSDSDCEPKAGAIALLSLSGILQTTGGLLLLFGALFPKKYIVRNDHAVTLLPGPVDSGYGLVLDL